MKKIFSLVTALVMLAVCTVGVLAYQSEDVVSVDPLAPEIADAVAPLGEKDWTVCIYMCGTDLETNYSAATSDIIEMLAADIPDDVNVLVMTGGTASWNPFEADKTAIEEDVISPGAYLTPDSEHTQIYSIDDDKMNLVYTYEENLDMGDVCTLGAFLEFTLHYAPAEHLMVSLWNHGGGPLRGVERDEITGNIISIAEYTEFVKALYTARGDKTDILGFDVCLAGNLETALNAAPYADYMVASAEVEPSSGWCYEWMSVFHEANKQNRTAGAEEVGRRIIETYPANEGHDWSDTTGLTLSLYDLSNADKVRSAFNNMAGELYASLDNPELYSVLSRRAEDVFYMMDGSAGLLDLYDFAYDMSDILPSADQLIDALGKIPGDETKYLGVPEGEDTFVIYRGVSPDYRECLGITFFYPTSRTRIEDEIEAGMSAIVYTSLEMSDNYSDFIYELLLRTDKLQYFKGIIELRYDYDSDSIVIEVENPEDTIALSRVDYTLGYTETVGDGSKISYDLGCAAVIPDWDNGIFEIPFDGEWYAIEGEVFTCEIKSTDSYYDVCRMPIILEGDTELALMTTYIMKDNPNVAYLGQIYGIDHSGFVNRSLSIDENTKFRTVLIEENDYGAKYEYYTFKPNEKLITPHKAELDGTEELALSIELMELVNSTDTIYEIRGRAWDSKTNLFYTNVMELFLSDDISVFSIPPIAPQIYTGSPVTPKIGMRYLDTDILLTAVFKVRYENNVEKGMGKVIVEIDEEDLKGEIVSEFEIKDVSEIYPGVTTDSWYFNYLAAMQSAGAVPSTNDLESDLTRAEFVELLYRFYNPMGADEELTFTDISEDSPYIPAIKWAKSTGIIQGITDKSFAPDKKITRLEMIVMLRRFDEERGVLLSDTEPSAHLADCDSVADWGKDAVHWAVANGIIKGNNGYLLPESYVTVSEALAMIWRCGK